jgi:hypothetical protein
VGRTPLSGHNPEPYLPWRRVAHVLGMPTLEFRDPVLLPILTKSDDALLTGHDSYPSLNILTIASMVFQPRVVAGTPNSLSIWPR